MERWEQFFEQLSKFGARGGFKPGLKRIEAILTMVGNPQEDFPAIHIAGTNGKGSTSAFLAALLQQSGFKVGLYTSPHLEDFRERMQINRNKVSHEELNRLVDELAPVYEGIKARGDLGRPTYFEVVTAAAFLFFARQKVDVAVVEAGLGGRLDATNVIKPLVAVITSIGFDHTAILGDTLSAIAREKAGIIKEGIPVVTGVDQQEALNVIEEKARLVGAPLFRLGKEVKLQITANDLAGSRATVEMAGRKYAELQIRLLGQHQARNAALAVAAYLLSREELPRTDRKQGGELEIIREGLAATWWPGRMELVNERPKVILDGAHNQAGMLELARFLAWNKDEFLQLYLIFGVLGDKDVKGMLAAVCHQVDYLVLTKNEYFRARNPEDVARNVAGLFSKVVIIPSEKEAVARVMELAGPEDLVCITGSLYTVGEVRKIFM